MTPEFTKAAMELLKNLESHDPDVVASLGDIVLDNVRALRKAVDEFDQKGGGIDALNGMIGCVNALNEIEGGDLVLINDEFPWKKELSKGLKSGKKMTKAAKIILKAKRRQ